MRIRAGALLCLLLVGAVRAGRTDRNESTATWLDVASSDFTTFRNSSLAKPGEGYSLQLSHASNDPVVAFREASNQSWVTVMVMSGGAGWKLLPRCRCSSASKRVQHISLQLTASDEPVVAFQEWTGSPPPSTPFLHCNARRRLPRVSVLAPRKSVCGLAQEQKTQTPTMSGTCVS